MLKRLLGLILFASIVCAGVAHAQGTTTPAAPNGTATTKPPIPMMSMMPSVGAGSGEKMSVTVGQVCAIGVGAVAGVVLFQGAMWHGMVIVGAALGGYVGDYLYKMHTTEKSAS